MNLREFAEIWLRDRTPPMWTGTAVCRRDLLLTAGLFREDCKTGQDSDMWLR